VFGKRLACRRAPALLCSRRLKLNETHTLATRAVGYTHHDPYAVPCDGGGGVAIKGGGGVETRTRAVGGVKCTLVATKHRTGEGAWATWCSGRLLLCSGQRAGLASSAEYCKDDNHHGGCDNDLHAAALGAVPRPGALCSALHRMLRLCRSWWPLVEWCLPL